MQQKLNLWAQDLNEVSLPAWENLPTIDLYSEQLIQYIRKLLWFMDSDEEPVITKAMINNYVKNGIIPKPEKKKYTRVHLAHLIAISTLKQVLTIPQINAGIVYQSRVSKPKGAYNLFCEEMNSAFKNLIYQINDEDNHIPIHEYSHGRKAMRFAANAFAYKMIAAKIVEIRLQLDGND